MAPEFENNLRSAFRSARSTDYGAKSEDRLDDPLDSRLDEAMKTKTAIVTFALSLATAACLAADTKIEQALRDLDAQWSAAAGAKDVDKTVSYYSDGAVVMPPSASAARTKEAFRSIWQ